MSPGIRVAVKNAVQAELKRHRGAVEPDPDGPPASAIGSKNGGRGKGCTAWTAHHLPRQGWELFFWCLRELAPRSRLSAEAHRAVEQTFNPSQGPLLGHTPGAVALW